MKKTSKIILMSVITIIACVSLISGATFALFTSESSVDISVSSGKVNVVATVDGLKYTSDTTEAFDTWSDAELEGDAYIGKFANDGTLSLAGNTLTLVNVTPGDAVKFNIAISNESTVSVLYRVYVMGEGELAQWLKMTVDGSEVATAGSVAISDWKEFTESDTREVILYLPAAVTSEQAGDSECNITIGVLAIQGNANTDGMYTERNGHVYNSDGVCVFCGAKFISAAPTTDEELNALLENLATPGTEVEVDLTQRIDDFSGTLEVQSTAVFNFGSYGLCGSKGNAVGSPIYVSHGGSLTINAEYTSAPTAGYTTVTDGSSLTINGGRYCAGKIYYQDLDAVLNADNSVIVINGGSILSNSGGMPMIKAVNGSTITINGGKIGGSQSGTIFTADASTIIITAGAVVNPTCGSCIAFKVLNGGKIIVSKDVSFRSTPFSNLEDALDQVRDLYNIVDDGENYIITEKV